jgi:dynein heavy chain
MFRVNARVLRDIVASKHTKIANEIIEIIAKIAKSSAEATMKAFEQVNAKIEAHPESIEELSLIRDFMENVPNDIVKLQNDILAGMKIYGILEGFQYQFKDDEDYDRQW